MDQSLMFDEKWEKALSEKDRKWIEAVFEKKAKTNDHVSSFHFLVTAVNYRKDLLVTVLIENWTYLPLSFENQKLRYEEEGELVAEHIFKLTRLLVPPKTSIPWTFIFPIHTQSVQPKLHLGKLTMVP